MNDSSEVILVRDGVSLAPLILPASPTPQNRLAADELAHYLEQISGALPEIVEGAPEPLPATAIWIGYQPALDNVVPQLDFTFTQPEEILLAAANGHLVLAGRDRWDADAMTVESTGTNSERVTDRQWEYGTANAVYAFLRDYLEVLWLWPGELGEEVPRQETIAFAPFEYRYHPQFRQRSTIFRLSAHGDLRGQSQGWARRQGLQLDSLQTPGGHAFTDWWQRFHESHSAYFALQPDGTRSGWPSPHRVKLCQSNPGVWEQWLADVKEQLRQNPHQTIFNAAPNDSAYNGICVCDNCTAWDHPDGATYPYRWESVQRDGVSMTDRYITFTNQLAHKLKERFPGRDYRVLQMAYHNSTEPPLRAVPDDSIILSYIGNFPLNDEADRERQKALLAGWQGLAPAFVYRPNQWVYAGSLGIPQVAPDKLIEDMAFLADHRCIGVFVDTTWEHWATTGPHYYLMGRLGWNPRLAGYQLLDEYYERGFGQAADDIRAYWELMAEEFGDLKYRDRLSAVVRDRFPQSRQAAAKTLLDQASAAVADQPTRYRQRVEFIRVGLDYTCLLFELVALMDQAGDSPDAATRRQLDDYWQQIHAIAEAHPYALHERWLTNRMARRGRYVPAGMD